MNKTFQQLRREKKVSLQVVADAANVSARDAYLFEIGAVVSDETKQKILHAFSQLTKQPVEEQPTVMINKGSVLQGLIGGNHDLHE